MSARRFVSPGGDQRARERGSDSGPEKAFTRLDRPMLQNVLRIPQRRAQDRLAQRNFQVAGEKEAATGERPARCGTARGCMAMGHGLKNERSNG